jgi:hypothetical protein
MTTLAITEALKVIGPHVSYEHVQDGDVNMHVWRIRDREAGVPNHMAVLAFPADGISVESYMDRADWDDIVNEGKRRYSEPLSGASVSPSPNPTE